MKPPADEDETGLPGFRTWRRVYGFVAFTLAAWITLLTILERKFP